MEDLPGSELFTVQPDSIHCERDTTSQTDHTLPEMI